MITIRRALAADAGGGEACRRGAALRATPPE